MFQKQSHNGEVAQSEHRGQRSRQVYGLDKNKSHYKQQTSDSYNFRLVLIGVLLAVLVGLAVLYLETRR